VTRHIFQACPVWIYTQSNITNIMQDHWSKKIFESSENISPRTGEREL
jgi:hypothetical protein